MHIKNKEEIMSTAKKRGLILLIACFVAALLFAVANKYYNIQPIELNIQIKSDRMDKFQVYYDTIGEIGRAHV